MRLRLLALLGGQAIALGLTVAFLVVPASAVFLHTYGAGALPFAYLAVAVGGVAVSSALTMAQRRMPLGRLALTVLSLYGVLVFGAWLLLSRWDMAWVTFVLIVLFPLSIPTGFLVVGAQAVRLYDVQTLKRDFPRIVSGFSIGFAAGGLAAAALVGPLGTATHLLLIDVAMALGFIGVVWATNRQYPGQLLAAPSETRRPTEPRRATPRLAELRLLREPFVLLVLGYQILSAAVTQLFDYVVWERAAAYYEDPESLAQFMGAFGAILNIVAVLFTLLLAGRLLARFGIGFGLLANPFGALLLTIVVLGVGAGPGIATFAYLVAVCAAQVVDITLTDGTTRTSIAATYQGIRRADRLRAQTFVEGAGIPIAVGLVGAFLLVVRALGLDVQAVVWTTGVLTLVWIWLAVRAHRRYGQRLGTVLTDRSWDPVALRVDDTAATAVGRLIESRDAVDRCTAIEVLSDARSPAVVPVATEALSDVAAAVRSVAVEAIAGADASGRPEVAARLVTLLADADAGVRARAAAAVSREGSDRREDGQRVWREVLADTSTRVEALLAAAAVPSAALVPDLVGLLGDQRTPPALDAALSAHGDHLVEELAGRLEGGSATPGTAILSTAVARGGGERGRELLLAALLDDRADVAAAAATGLSRVPRDGRAAALDARARRAVATAVDREVLHAGRLVDAVDALDASVDAAPLREALADELAESSRRLLTLVGVVVPGLTAERVTAGLGSSDEGTRGLAQELVSVALGRRASRVLAVVTPGLAPRERLAGLGRVAAVTDPAALVVDIARGAEVPWRDPWLRACALRVLPGLAPDAVDEVVATLRTERRAGSGASAAGSTLDRVVTETVQWLDQAEASVASRKSASASADPELP